MVYGKNSIARRGQTATEYLIILAVVIIIALIVVGVLGGIPGIGGSSRASAADAYWQTSELGVPAYAFSATGSSSTITIKNNRAASIIVTDVRISDALTTVGTAATASVFNNTGNASLANQTLAAGGTYKYDEGTDISSASMKNVWDHGCTTAGDTFTVYVEVDYTDVPTSATYTFDGDDNALEGTCAD